jgi:parallel beta-helix repeat protein
MQHRNFPASRAVGRRARTSRWGAPVFRGALLGVLGLLAGPQAWATNITTCPFTISTSGDYHVTQNLTCSSTSKPAISVIANNVTLSLDGHTITGPGRTQFQAVAIDVGDESGVSVSNGTIASFGVAVELEDGATRSSVSGLTINNCDDGIDLDFGANGNTVSSNTITSGDVGIAVGGSNNNVSSNTSSDNETGISINDDTAHGNMVEGNTALGNSSVDLEDVNANCDSNIWAGNCFGTKSQSCIGTSVCGTQIACPSNQTVTAATGQTSAAVAVGTATPTPAGRTVVGVREDGKALTDPYPIGVTTIRWTVDPGQEDATTCTQTITVLAGSTSTPPSLTCPASQSVTAAAGQTSAAVVVGMATSTSAGATIIGVRSDGKALTAPYPVGATTITWMVTDAHGQLASCTQTITVQVIVVTPPILHLPTGADPHIISVFVDHGPLQQEVIIHGSGFADLEGTSYVTLGGQQIPVLLWSNDAIDVLINPQAYGQGPLPLNAAYPVQVIIQSNGRRSNTVDYFLTDGPPAVYGP